MGSERVRQELLMVVVEGESDPQFIGINDVLPTNVVAQFHMVELREVETVIHRDVLDGLRTALFAAEAERDEARAVVAAVEAQVRIACPLENCEDQEALYICFNDDADPIIEADTLDDAVRQMRDLWDAAGEGNETLRRELHAARTEAARLREQLTTPRANADT